MGLYECMLNIKLYDGHSLFELNSKPLSEVL